MASPTTQSQPVTFSSAQDENSAIAQSLAARRRRSLASVLRDFRIGRSAHKTIDDRVVQEELEEEDDDEYEDPERVNTLDLEAYKRAMGDTIKIEQSGEIIDPDSIETEAAGLELVWDGELLIMNHARQFLISSSLV